MWEKENSQEQVKVDISRKKAENIRGIALDVKLLEHIGMPFLRSVSTVLCGKN
jgi:hypothetical protein